MAGQVWGTDSLGGNLAQDYLTKYLRYVAQPLTRFRQICDVKEAIGKKRGDTFNWDVIANIGTAGGTLTETSVIPSAEFTVTKGTGTVYEFGNSIPMTRKVKELSQHDVHDIIRKTLANDMVKTIDKYIWTQVKSTQLIFLPSAGTSTTSIEIDTNGTCGTASNATAGLTYNHVIEIVAAMKEYNIPTFDGENYLCITHPSTLTKIRKDLVSLQNYTESGRTQFLNGEVGKIEGMRFVEQTNISKVTPTNAGSGVGWAAFFGGEAMIEAISVPEQIIEKEVTDYGRSMGLAWYMIAGYTPAFPVSTYTNNRIALWWPNAEVVADDTTAV